MAYFNNYIAETKDQSPFTTANPPTNGHTNHTGREANTGLEANPANTGAH